MSTQSDTDPNRVIIFDTTLRDGEQSPGCSMNLEEKLKIAKMLEGMGVDVIEAGFPIASPGDFEAVNEIAKVVKDAVVCGLARSGNMDVDAAGEALAPAERKRVHTFISTSPLHMSVKLQMEPEDILRSSESILQTMEITIEGLDHSGIIKLMIEHPILMQRPIVRRGDRAIIGRPPENVLALID